MNILYWNIIKNVIESTHKFPYNILFTFLMDRRRAPNGIGHLMILLLYQSNHGYGKSFSTELSFSQRAFWIPIMKLPV